MQACTIGLSINEDIKTRTRKRSKKGRVYIHSAESPAEPLTRVRNSSITVPYSAVTLFSLNETLEPNYRAPLLLPIDIEESPSPPTDLGESLLPPIESLNTLVKKKPYYITVPTEEAEL